MRLCDAIRDGSKKTKPIYRKYIDFECGACAVGAAAIGLGLSKVGNGFIGSDTSKLISDMFPFLKVCPVCKIKVSAFHFGTANYYGDSSNIISHIYESHLWTREAIADWIEREFESGARLSNREVQDEQYQEARLANAN